MPFQADVVLPQPVVLTSQDFLSSHHERESGTIRTAVVGVGTGELRASAPVSDRMDTMVIASAVVNSFGHEGSPTVVEDEIVLVKDASSLVASLCGTHRLQSGHLLFQTSVGVS